MAEIIRSTALGRVPHGFSAREALAHDDILPGAPLALLEQVHSSEVCVLHEFTADRPQADALVTDQRGLLVGIVTADCAPVLLADAEAGVVAAAHAGWRGAHGGILENTVGEMERLGARRDRIVAAIGPAIAQQSYEVDSALKSHFEAADERFFAPGKDGRFQFDLPAYVADRLAKAGVDRIDDLALDTYGEPARFHSYRRSTHRGEPSAGRQLSVIGLTP